MIKLAVFDVDGTLVSREDRILLPSTIKALKALQEKNIKIAIASGRPPFAMEKSLISQIDFDYFICSNGTYVMDHNEDELFRREMSKEDVEDITADFEKNDDAIMFQFEDHAYAYHGYKRIKNMVHRCLGRLELLMDDRERKERHLKSLPFSAVSKIEEENISSLRNKYTNYRFESFMEGYYDIYPNVCTKATGIEHVCANIGIGMENVIAFGDALNDVEMIKASAIGVVMEDGLEEVKDIADYITSSSRKDGIYNACIQFNLIEGEKSC